MRNHHQTSVSIHHFSDLMATFESLGLAHHIKAADRIAVKPNLCAGTICLPPSGVVTNPQVLDMVVQALVGLNDHASVAIVESDSTGPGLAVDKFAHQGYPQRFSRYSQVRLVDLSRSPVSRYTCPGRYFRHGLVLPRIIREADLFVSVGKMKTHSNTVVTGILKNQFGCLPESDKEKYHPFLPEVIADINAVARPHLCILDAVPAMEGNGPVQGSPVDLDLLILGTDPVAVDSTMARMMGFDPERIPMLRVAQDAGIGTTRPDHIAIRGLPMDSVCRPFRYISWERHAYVQLGFAIQRFGKRVQDFGHLVHCVEGTAWAARKLHKRMRQRLGKNGDG